MKKLYVDDVGGFMSCMEVNPEFIFLDCEIRGLYQSEIGKRMGKRDNVWSITTKERDDYQTKTNDVKMRMNRMLS